MCAASAVNQERPPLKATIVGRFDDMSFRERQVLGKTQVESELVTWATRAKITLYPDGSGTLVVTRTVGESIKTLHQYAWGSEAENAVRQVS